MNISEFTPSQIEGIRQRCKTDLWFLAKDVLGKNLQEFTHRQVINFFVQKDPSFATFREFADQYTFQKDRLLLLPRKSYKSTLKVIDNLQWLLCFPDITIITLTAANKLASSFVQEFQNYFVVKGATRDKAGKMSGGEPTFFQQLFPEFCITEKESVKAGEFTSPARKVFSKEPTIGSLSIEQSGSGWSVDLLDFDDVLSDQNTATGLQLEKLAKAIDMATNLRKKYGFRTIVGTRYNPLDAYGNIAEANGVKQLYGSCDTPDLKYLCMPCWWLKDTDYIQPDYKNWVPNAADLTLFFPQDLSFKILAKELREGPDTFFSQELNNPVEAAGMQFTEDLIKSAFIDHTQLPKIGQVYTVWDIAYSVKEARDYTVGVTGLLDEHGEWWITDIIRGRYDYSELPYQIVNAIRLNRPVETLIEDSNGVSFLKPELNRVAKDLGVELKINWASLGQGRANQKYDRMITTHPLFTTRRIHILNTIGCTPDLVKEFIAIGNQRQRNDIPDAISRMTTTYSGLAQAKSLQTPEEQLQEWHSVNDREFHDMIFRQGRYAYTEPAIEVPEEPPYESDPYTGLPQ